MAAWAGIVAVPLLAMGWYGVLTLLRRSLGAGKHDDDILACRTCGDTGGCRGCVHAGTTDSINERHLS